MMNGNDNKPQDNTKSGWSKLGGNLSKLIDVKSLVTLAMTAAMIGLLFSDVEVGKDLLMLFSTSYGAVIAYFFNRQSKGDGGNG